MEDATKGCEIRSEQRKVKGNRNKTYLSNPLDKAVVRVNAFVIAFQALESSILYDLECYLEPTTSLFQFAHNAVGNIRNG